MSMAVPENTSGRTEARQALADAHRSSAVADRMIAESRELLGQVRANRLENHYTQKLREIIRQGRDKP